jgi:hypothetical protein
MAGVLSLPHHSPPSHLDDGRRFPRRHPLAVASIVLATGALVGLVLYLTAYLATRDFDPLGGIDSLWQGGHEASQTAGFATSEGLGYGQLTQSELQSRFSSTNWLSASTVSTYVRGQRTGVSFLATDGHIVTAVAEEGGCSWGLAVHSSSDPIITSDSLSGPGVYWTFTSATTAQYAGGNPPCDASSALRSGWSPLDGVNVAG